MSIFDIFWIYFVLMSLQPAISQRLLEWKRADLLRKLENKRRSRVIALVHRQETMSLLGFPLVRYINIEDSEQVLRAIKLTDNDVPIDLILHTPGGLALAARQIAHALENHKAKVTVFVPHYAMSGGTLIALAADEIVTAVAVPVPASGTGAVYEKFVTRSSEDRPCVGVFAAARRAADGTFADVRVAVGAAAETPQRFPDLEAQATGTDLGDDIRRAIADGYAGRITTLDDVRGSAWYRTEMVRVWVRRALEQAAAGASAAS
jgi:hypothetical protein